MAESRRSRIARKLPRRLQRPARDFYRWWRDRSLRFAATSRFGASGFYALSGEFDREMRAVAAGRERFAESQGKPGVVDYTLRRNTHRIEKGLVSRPRRETFAVDYIEETVDHLVRGVANTSGLITPGSELAWARDVLNEYFSVVHATPTIARARERFRALSASLANPRELPLTPYSRDLSQAPPITYEAFSALTHRRRSVRWFLDRVVPRELIDAAIEAAAQSPSACNRQPFEFYVYDQPEDVQRVAGIPGGTAGFAHNFPVIVAVVGKLDAFFAERDRHLIYIDGSLASMAFMLALETLGLSSCPINTPNEEAMEKRMATELGLAQYERPVMLIALGYPDPEGMVPRSQKKSLDQLRRYNP